MVADAGGNAIDVVNHKGRVRNLAVFANRLVPNPFGGPDIPMQAVPTSVVGRIASTTSASSPASRSRPAAPTSTA